MPETQILGVLNGADRVLEGFWNLSRRDFYRDALEAGFALFTGPTYSVTQEGFSSSTNQGTSAFHNLAMLRRHNQVVQEVSDAGLGAVPNLYWRTEADRDRWVDWLHRHPAVNVVSRDLSRSKVDPSFSQHLCGVVDILRRADRAMHVLLVGVGLRNGVSAMRLLAQVGATCSVVTALPIMRALAGRRIRYKPGADLETAKTPDYSVAPRDLMVPNLRASEDYLLDVARGLPGYGRG